METSQASPVGGIWKRALDVAVSGTALIVAAPVILLFGLLIRLQDGGPMFFGHNRLGFGRQSFRCLKLRTMVSNGDVVLAQHLAQNPAAKVEWETTRKLRDDPRVTALGRFLRKTSLDELPQLFNILRGDMSLVGPRPVTGPEIAYYGVATRYYTATRPGLTGLWQVSGRSDVDFARRVTLDTYYVRRWSFVRDMMIILRTPMAVLRSRGSY
ncbi:MAG: sugar transferase [Henriciella sp.]|uniref:sugar transferase n=1 Tax=Henriciella sp. TaxID=1968823 RepID=UPI003C74F238